MSLVFAAIAPHGTLAVPEAPAAAVEGGERTQSAMEELARRFGGVSPDATIVLTPHNVHVDGHFAVVLAGALSGSLADWDAPTVELGCPVDVERGTSTSARERRSRAQPRPRPSGSH